MNDDIAAASAPTGDPVGTSGRPLWMQVVLGLFLAVVGLLAVLLLIAFVLPSTFVVNREIVINAPAGEIHPYVNTLHRWPDWTAWNSESYPELTYSYEGPESGVGAVQTWDDPQMGGGRLEITKSSEESGIEFSLEFERAAEPLNGSISYTPIDEQSTKVSWTGRGDVGTNPIGRYFGLMMDSMIGTDYEKGLRNLKIVVEAPPAE